MKSKRLTPSSTLILLLSLLALSCDRWVEHTLFFSNNSTPSSRELVIAECLAALKELDLGFICDHHRPGEHDLAPTADGQDLDLLSCRATDVRGGTVTVEAAFTDTLHAIYIHASGSLFGPLPGNEVNAALERRLAAFPELSPKFIDLENTNQPVEVLVGSRGRSTLPEPDGPSRADHGRGQAQD